MSAERSGERILRLTDLDGNDRYPVGQGVVILFTPDGWYAVEHVCKEWDDDEGHVVKVVAPRLTVGGHVIQSTSPLTITPSILCPDCGLHGFVTNGEWTGDPGARPCASEGPLGRVCDLNYGHVGTCTSHGSFIEWATHNGGPT